MDNVLLYNSIHMDRLSPEINCSDLFGFSNISFPLYSEEDVLISDDDGNEEEETDEESEDLVSDNQVDEETEDSVSDNSASENSVSENNYSGSESENSVSGNGSVSDDDIHHAIGYQDPWSGDIIIDYDSHLDEYMPTVIDLLTIIGALALALVVFELLKYIYKFFRVFF